MKAIIVASLALMSFTWSLPAKPLRATFLSESNSLLETTELLKKCGFKEEATRSFQQIVRRYNAVHSELDLRKFPSSAGGFFRFESASDLVTALPHKLCDTSHSYDLTCFDAVILLARNALQVAVEPDNLWGPFLAPHTGTNGEFMILPTANARDAFGLVYPPWYREATHALFPGTMEDSRICLVASLFQCHVLPLSTNEGNLEATVIRTLNEGWKRLGTTFPSDFELVLCHQISLPERRFATVHAGLLLKNQKGFAYIEKAGGQGPFVRLDFEDRGDLKTWLAATFTGAEKMGYTHHFATFNNSRIEQLPVRSK